MKIKQWCVQLLVIVLLAGCSGARYGHLTARMKKEAKSEAIANKNIFQQHETSTTNTSELLGGTTLMEQKTLSVAEPLHIEGETSIGEKANKPTEQEIIKELSQTNALHFPSSDSTDITYVREQYKRANKLTTIAGWSLGLGWLLFFPFNVILSLILSIIALGIYRKYKNPGVDEKYVGAVTVLVISAVILVALTVGIYLFILFL